MTQLFRSKRLSWIDVQCYYTKDDAFMLYYCHKCEKSNTKDEKVDQEDDFKNFENNHENCNVLIEKKVE